ncbi:MAG TPA: hypothetical protein VMW72_03550 [Sedimentisphaerales bacterium]|nr:hypothetical protein [Sedimentisphaerales bacterium]
MKMKCWFLTKCAFILYMSCTLSAVTALRKESPGLLMAISASDGTELAQYQLDSSPVFDGMAAAYGRLYVSMEDGSLLCLTKE